MAGAGTAGGQGSGVGKLESQIYCIKYTLFCFNVILWVSVPQGAVFELSLFVLDKVCFKLLEALS